MLPNYQDVFMPVTLTIKHVPDAVAEKLRLRAAASHRSLQGELMAILHAATEEVAVVREPEPPAYAPTRAPKRAKSKMPPVHGKRLTLSELWERSRRLLPNSKSESAEIVRALRDERHGR
jgi:antitoxin FitA